MRVNHVITNVVGGELSPQLYSRLDLPIFQQGLSRCENFIVNPQGGAKYRQGTKLVHNTRFGLPAILIPFQFNDTQDYVIELTNQAARFYKEDGVILRQAKPITAATKANPTVITSAAHGYSVGQEIFVDGIVGMTELNGRFFLVTAVGANTITLGHPIHSTNEDSTAYTTYSSGGTVASVYEIATPYTVDNLQDLRWAQSGNLMYICSQQYEPRKLTRTSHTTWTLSTYARTSDPFGTVGNYPRAVCFDSSGRLVFGGTKNAPETVFGSMTPNSAGNRYDNFTVSTGPTDAFIFSMAPSLGRPDIIEWLANVNKNIVIGSYSSVRRMYGATEENSITAAGVTVKPLNNFGSENVVPVMTGDRLYYVQRNGRPVRSIEYNFGQAGYLTLDRNSATEHLVTKAVIQLIECQGTPDLLWCVKEDGKLIALTTYREQQSISGWHRHYIGGNHVPDSPSLPTVPGTGAVLPWAKVLNVSRLSRLSYQDQMVACVERLGNIGPSTTKVITAVTKANPGVVTAASHGYSNGQRVHIAGVVGMTEVNDKYFIISGVTANTYKIDVDTTNYTTYVSGGVGSRTFTNRTIEYLADYVDYPHRNDFYTGTADTEVATAAIAASDDLHFLNSLYEKQKEAIHVDMAASYDGSLLGANAVKNSVNIAADNAKVITAATAANPGVFTTAAHGFVTGDAITFSGLAGGSFTAFNGLVLICTVLSSTTFHVGINTTGFGVYTASSGTATRKGVSLLLAPFPVQIHTASAHGRSVGDRIYIKDIIGTEELNNQYFLVGSVPNTTALTLLIDGTNTALIGSSFTAYVSGGTISQFGATLTLGSAAVGTGISLTSDVAVFTAAMVGRQIWKKYDENGNGGGRATITAFTNSTTVTVSITVAFDSNTPIQPGKWLLTATTITGLHHLIGETVRIVADGGQVADQVVSNLGTLTVAACSRLVAGKGYRGILETLNLDVGGVTGSAQAKKRNVYKAAIRFLNSLGTYFGVFGTFFGTSEYFKTRIEFQATWDLTGRPTPPFTGVKHLLFSDRWDDVEKKVLIIHDTPMPCTVLSMDIFMNVSDEG